MIFCRVKTTQIDYIIVLSNKNNDIIHVKKKLYTKLLLFASLSTESHLSIYALLYIVVYPAFLQYY